MEVNNISDWYMCTEDYGFRTAGTIYWLNNSFAEIHNEHFRKATQEEIDAVNPSPSVWPEGYAEKLASEWAGNPPEGYHEALMTWAEDFIRNSIPKSEKTIGYFKQRFESVFKELQEVHGRTKSVCIGHKNEVWHNGMPVNDDIDIEIIFA